MFHFISQFEERFAMKEDLFNSYTSVLLYLGSLLLSVIISLLSVSLPIGITFRE